MQALSFGASGSRSEMRSEASRYLSALGPDQGARIHITGQGRVGKTELAREIAGEIGEDTVTITKGELQDAFVGQAAIKLRKKLKTAQDEGKTVILDDVHEMTPPTEKDRRLANIGDLEIQAIGSTLQNVLDSAPELNVLAISPTRTGVEPFVTARLPQHLNITA